MTAPLTTPPSRSSLWPVEVRRFLTAKLLERMLQDHDGWHGLVQWMYGGQMRGEERLPMRPSIAWLWDKILADAAAWDAARTAEKAGTP